MMAFTIADVLAGTTGADTEMHCFLRHSFRWSTAYRDAHGTWCPDCGNFAHTGPGAGCDLCYACLPAGATVAQ